MNIAAKLVERVKNSLLDAPQRAYETALNERWKAHCEGIEYQRSEQLEADVLKDWRYAVLYAAHVLEGQFRAFEIAVQTAAPAKDVNDIAAVATYIKRLNIGIWPTAEKHLANDARFAFEYARDSLGRRWPEDSDADRTILQHPEFAEKYKSRFPFEFKEIREQMSATWR
jgi:hypothetical protein